MKITFSARPSADREGENVWRLGGVEEMRVKHPIFESLRYTPMLTLREKHEDDDPLPSSHIADSLLSVYR